MTRQYPPFFSFCSTAFSFPQCRIHSHQVILLVRAVPLLLGTVNPVLFCPVLHHTSTGISILPPRSGTQQSRNLHTDNSPSINLESSCCRNRHTYMTRYTRT